MTPNMSHERTSGALSDSRRNAIVVLGEALVDLFPDRRALGGAPFNVARNIAALGGQPVLITRIGSDELGDEVAAEFRRFHMDERGLQRDTLRPTGTVTVHLQGTQHRFEIAQDQAWDRLDAAAVTQLVRSVEPAVVYFGTLAQRGSASRDAIRAGLAATNACRFLDLNLRDGPDNQRLAAESLQLAQLVKVNDDELDSLLTWFIHPGQAPVAWGQPRQRESIEALMRRYDIQRLVVTRGASGWACFDARSNDVLEGTSPAVSVRDTVGAGDAFASVLLLGEVRGWPLATTLQRAGDFASAVCTIRGGVDIDSGIYRAALAAWGGVTTDGFEQVSRNLN